MNKLSPQHQSHHSLPSLLSVSTASVSNDSIMRTMFKPRRRAGVSHTVTSACKSRRKEVEGGKQLKRSAVRRYAITKYSQLPLPYMKSLRKRVDSSHSNRHILLDHTSPASEKLPPADQGRLIVFDLQDVLATEITGSKHFLNLINLCYGEKYRYAKSGTHRSIVRSIILDEIKSNGYRFVKKDLLRPGYFYILDDSYAMRLIKNQLSIEKLKNIERNIQHAHLA